MASGIPPLLPASPPPMCKDDFNEVETDDSANEDNDEFGDFSIATPADHSNKPTNDTCTSEEIEPTISATNFADSSTNQVFEHESEITNSSLRETQSDDESTGVRLKNEEPVDETNSSNDDDDISSFVTVELPSVADHLFDSPPVDAETSISNGESAIDDLKSDLTFDQDVAPAENNFAIRSPSSSDSESIDIPDDSFIVCDETNSNQTSDFLAASENHEKVDSIFGEFATSDHQTSGYPAQSYENLVSSDPVATDTPVLDADFDTEFQSSDDFFQPFADVSVPFANEKVTKLESNDVFGAKIDVPSGHSLSSLAETTKQDSETEEIAPVQFSCDFDDDDFSDFVSPTTFVQSKVVETNTCDPVTMQPNVMENVPSFCGTNDISANEKCLFEQDSASTTPPELNWTEIFCVPAEDHIEVNVNTIEGKLKCSSVWCKIKDIENSPALHYNWIDSDTNKLLLATLCVDSRNILFGPRWSSEVPRFASNLGFTPLVPQKAADKSPQNEFPDLCGEVSAEIVGPLTELNPTMSSVPDAHFDWNNSGLTNPLDSYSHSSLLDLDLLASFDIHSPYYRKKSKPEKNTVAEDYELQNSVSILSGSDSEAKTLSSEATKILNSLPNLVVMEKQYIVFPIR